MLKTIVLVATGGALGSTLRYLTSVLVERFFQTSLPLATFIANVLGCFLIGLFIGFLDQNLLKESMKWFLITGFCGGFTTFSAFGFENYNLITSSHPVTALLYISISVLAGIFAIYFGLLTAQ